MTIEILGWTLMIVGAALVLTALGLLARGDL
jgi:hypothetical protein